MKALALVTLALVVGLFAVPLSSATVMHATIDTQTNVATINASSNYALFLTYPSNSSMSQELNGTVEWYNSTSYLNSSGMMQLGSDMNERGFAGQNISGDSRANNSRNNIHANSTNDTNSTQEGPQVHVVNATLNYQVHIFANETNLTVYRNLTMALRITNITEKVGNNSTIVDMSWRAFGVQGKLMSDFHGMFKLSNPNKRISIESQLNTNMDVNQLGDMGIGDQFTGGFNFELGDLFENGGFGNHLQTFSTINFHVFSVPLNNWTRVYNSGTNTTTLYYNTTASYLLNESQNINGNIYSLRVKADPSASLTTYGYAVPTSSNALTVYATSPQIGSSSIDLIIVAAVVVVAIVSLAAALIIRKKSRK